MFKQVKRQWDLECYFECKFNTGELEVTDMQFCQATKNQFESLRISDFGEAEGVPEECPIFQGEVEEPWNKSPTSSICECHGVEECPSQPPGKHSYQFNPETKGYKYTGQEANID